MNKNNKLDRIITKVLLTIIVVLVCLIYNNKTNKLKSVIFENNLNFSKYNNKLSKLFDKKIFNNNDAETVFLEQDDYNETKYLNGTKITYDSIEPIFNIESGVVVYIGEKDNLGHTLIVQGIDGYDIWYSNIDNISVSIYDYIEKNTIIGNSKQPVITIVKDGNYILYEDYKSKV